MRQQSEREGTGGAALMPAVERLIGLGLIIEKEGSYTLHPDLSAVLAAWDRRFPPPAPPRGGRARDG